MKTLISFVAPTIVMMLYFCRPAFAYDSKNFKNNWFTQGSFSQRYMVLNSNPVSIATMTQSSELASKTSEEKLVNGLKMLTGIETWKVESRGNYTSYEAYGKKQARFFKFLIRKIGDRIHYSLASIRITYLFPTYYETEILQREYLKVNDKKVSKWLWDELIPAAHAKALTAADIRSALNSWNTGMNGLGNLGSVSNQLQSLNNNFHNASNSIDNLANKLTPGNAAKVGAAAGMGLAFGEMAAHLIADGIMFAVPAGYNFLMGNVDDESRKRINDRTQGSLEKLELLTKKTVELEKKMGKHLIALASLVDGKSPEDLAYEIAVLENTRDQKDKEFKKTNNRCTFNEKSELEKQISLLKESQLILANTGASKTEDICNEFENMQIDWISNEDEMQLARTAIIQQSADIFANASTDVSSQTTKITSNYQDERTCKKDSNLDSAHNDVNRVGCICATPMSTGKTECVSICAKLRAAQDLVDKCLAQVQYNRDHAQDLSKSANYAAAKALEHRSQKITEMLNKLRKEESFSALRNSMHNKFNAVSKLCDRPDLAFKDDTSSTKETAPELPLNPKQAARYTGSLLDQN